MNPVLRRFAKTPLDVTDQTGVIVQNDPEIKRRFCG
jgi:hypothetical protein